MPTRDVDWDIALKKLYVAYVDLNDYKTADFKKYIPRRHSPGRGLLLRLGLIEERPYPPLQGPCR